MSLGVAEIMLGLGQRNSRI